ncbi:TetR/AcrR family transcriptional regulator [Campylobacter sp. MG1]|uniref:TetR/AcrR family transcriptional regulator n=1 Tax=Campylobacter sp. MG1 TaxID=2976332 RepID=UPI00226CA35C|nr:TetR/AcrR family transcriptional regulator [Campylobacter sp. MG1]
MEGKEELILKIALELFLEKGYENTNIKDIVDIVGGSYTTIYKKFKNKNQLFLKAIKIGGDGRVARLVDMVESRKNLNLVEFLDSFARDFYTDFYSDYNVKFLRLVVSRSYHDKTLQEIIAKSDKLILSKHLAKVFESKLDKAIFKEIDSINLAVIYTSMILTNETFSVLANTKFDSLTEKQISKHINNINSLFLRMINIKNI